MYIKMRRYSVSNVEAIWWPGKIHYVCWLPLQLTERESFKHIDMFIYSEHKQYKTSEYIQYHTHKQQGFTFQLPSQSLVEVWIA